MKLTHLHDWEVDPATARAIQAELAGRVDLNDGFALDQIRQVAGVDNAYRRTGEVTVAFAAVVVLSFPALEHVETRVATHETRFPYVPGLLSFREAPAILAAFADVDHEPDVVLCDGQGLAHPRRLGLATHLGLFLDLPTIGCAKSRLIGQYQEPTREFGAATPLVDRGEIVGAAVRTRPRHAPLFVSPGHKISRETAVAITLACCRDGQFMPEPTRLAHEAVSAAARAWAAGEGLTGTGAGTGGAAGNR